MILTKEKAIYYGLILMVISMIAAPFTVALYPYLVGINGRHLEYITGVGEHSLYITQSTDHSPDPLYGNYTLADGVVLPSYLVETGRGWAYVTLDWGLIIKVEAY